MEALTPEEINTLILVLSTEMNRIPRIRLPKPELKARLDEIQKLIEKLAKTNRL